jgi:hypothetical protein
LKNKQKQTLMKSRTEQELDIITRMRGEVMSRKEPTGVNLFLVWGYPTVVVLLLEFASEILWNADWYVWLWAGIPLVGAPLMAYYVKEDYERVHHRTLEQNVVIQLWFFIGGACCLSGFTMGFAGVYEQCYCTFEGLLVGMGSFLTGVISRSRYMKVCGLIGSLLSFVCLFLQGSLWPCQLLLSAVIIIITLVIPGHMTRHYVIKAKREE